MEEKKKSKKDVNGMPHATFYMRKNNWTMRLYDKDGIEYAVNPKHCIESSKLVRGD